MRREVLGFLYKNFFSVRHTDDYKNCWLPVTAWCVLLITVLFSSKALAAVHEVKVYDFYYEPKDIVIQEEDTVRWVWIDDFHDTQAGLPPEDGPTTYDGAFKSPVANAGFGFEVTFTREMLVQYPAPSNRYDYICTPHYTEGMVGSITVTRKAHDLIASLSADQEVPPTDSEQTGNCTGVLSAGETSVSIECNHQLQNVTGAHIHQEVFGRNGSIFCNLTGTNPLTATCPLTPSEANALWDGAMYVNIHTAEFPNGEIRGQLFRKASNLTVSGKVTLENGNPVPGVTIVAGSRSAKTNSKGKYTIYGLDTGIYTLTASKLGYQFMPKQGTNPAMLNAQNAINREFLARIPKNCSGDHDIDKLCDEQEAKDGSNPEDRGSFRERLKYPLYVAWNGFLGMENTLEVINKSATPGRVTYSLHDISGARTHSQELLLPAKSERQVSLNTLPGFAPQSYGLLKIEVPDELKNSIDGGMLFYRATAGQAPGESSYDFAYGVPFLRPNYGESAAAFNTIQPSANPAESGNLVSQWLSIVNLNATSEKIFTIKRYSQSGEQLSSQKVTIPQLGRVDLEAGHQNPGPGFIGLIRIIPKDSLSPYLAQVHRYGEPAVTAGNQGYQFAFPLFSRPANGETQYVSIANTPGADNWLELANASSSRVRVRVNFYDQQGISLQKRDLNLAPYAQEHLSASTLLPAGTIGFAKVVPDTNGSIIGESMYYFRNQLTGSIEATFASPLRQALGKSLYGNYNLERNMKNELRFSNVSNAEQQVRVLVYDPAGAFRTKIYDLAARSSLQLSLDDPALFGLLPNSAGVITIEFDNKGDIFSELVRKHLTPAGAIDFATPMPLR